MFAHMYAQIQICLLICESKNKNPAEIIPVSLSLCLLLQFLYLKARVHTAIVLHP